MGFVSHRISIAWPPASPAEPTSTIVLTTSGRHFVDLRALHPLSSHALYWGIAGTSSYDTETGIGTWNHVIDSRTDEQFSESGIMSTLEDGTVLEKGVMVDFDDGILKPYEEVWRDEDISEDDIAVAAECVTDGYRGLAIILGVWCQILVKREEEVYAGRWRCSKDGIWIEEFISGERLHCDFPVMLDAKVDDAVSFSGLDWVVVERQDG